MLLVGLALLLAAPKYTEPPAEQIPVAFVVSEGANLLDLAGAWEVFQDCMVEKKPYVSPFEIYSFMTPDEEKGQLIQPFRLYTVAESRAPIHMTGGLQVTPAYTFDDAPPPQVVVIGAQSGQSPRMLDWLRRQTQRGEAVVMSVGAGAFKLAQTGALRRKKATTHHDFFDTLQKQFPETQVQRGPRYVKSDERIFTAGGVTAGIDLALHVVELYFGRETAARTARSIEYEGTGWQRTGG